MELRGAAVVTVPPSLTAAAVRALHDALGAAAAGNCGAVVLRGTGGVFCRGLDLAAVASGADAAPAIDLFVACLHTVRTSPRPTIAFVEGEALGGGVGIAAAADVVLATPAATFALPELLFGVIPAIVRPYLAERLAPQKLRSLALLAERLDADAALRIGLVDRVAAPEHCAAALRSWIGRLGRVDADAVRAWKRLTQPVVSLDDASLTLAALASPRTRQRLGRFVDAGVPPWLMEEP